MLLELCWKVPGSRRGATCGHGTASEESRSGSRSRPQRGKGRDGVGELWGHLGGEQSTAELESFSEEGTFAL